MTQTTAADPQIPATHSAWVARQHDDAVDLAIESVTTPTAGDGDLLVRVEWSGVNYKDALAVTPRGGVVREYPIVPGIDLAGVVVASGDPSIPPGTSVLAHGYDIGTGRDGGYAEYALVSAAHAVVLDGLSTHDAAAIGTAGFTAAESVDALVRHGVATSDGPVLVTGASGGVGSVAVNLLATLGYEVVASTGKTGAHALLRDLGAAEIVGRFDDDAPKPLGKARWAGVVDGVGGATLAEALSTVRYGGAVAASGLTGGVKIPTTVMPFILRGVALLGIDSVQLPIAPRRELWRRLDAELRPSGLMALVTDVDATEIAAVLDEIRGGGRTGRTAVRIAGGFG
ncbi:oxidoreductase [Rhodococcus rhodnii]|uniref:Dehydrogenase n=2 Tax=Rhodococcus rhodnii TaxID=38312 RepID=R7WQ73_9NOCA|nr:acryloyl-CoA reductase [Rhodococcus rhodnii]EOM77467.1 dehydrogenase [Rhodococcus rhodnii LMG 5362]TXG92541.1 oxidoreductase [Rhodococcus rhodnii]